MNAVETLDLRPGEWVEVRSESEVLAMLDDNATLDGLPFMPEMLVHCGRRYQVYKRADRTCDVVSAGTGLFRHMQRTVHLSMLRCDGLAHGGCQARCLMFWKEAWLRRVTGDEDQVEPGDDIPSAANPSDRGARDRAWLAATVHCDESGAGEVHYRCQATEVNKASCPLPWWKPKQYVRDVCANDVPVRSVVRSIALVAFSKVVHRLTGRSFPNVAGSLKRTPSESLGLQSGDWVVVKSKEEILATLDTAGRNRGMTFESEMLPYCGKRFRVLCHVEQIIEESSGRMLKLAGVSVILENVICASYYRRACARSNYLYWREVWLRRVTSDETPEDAENSAQGVAHANSL